MICRSYIKGKLVEKREDYDYKESRFGVVRLRNVPLFICTHCEETVLTAEACDKIEEEEKSLIKEEDLSNGW